MGFHIPKILKHFVKHRPLRAGSYANDFQTQIVCALNKKLKVNWKFHFFILCQNTFDVKVNCT